MGMDTPESFESTYSQPDPFQIRDPDPLVIAHDDMGHFATPGYQQGHLSLYLKWKDRYLAGQFTGDDLVTGYSSAVYFLETF